MMIPKNLATLLPVSIEENSRRIKYRRKLMRPFMTSIPLKLLANTAIVKSSPSFNTR